MAPNPQVQLPDIPSHTIHYSHFLHLADQSQPASRKAGIPSIISTSLRSRKFRVEHVSRSSISDRRALAVFSVQQSVIPLRQG
jgi:hypothetical protein